MMNSNKSTKQELCFSYSLKKLDRINRNIARLSSEKEELTQRIISELEHNHEGQKSYDYAVWRVEVRTPFVYALDKKKYESGVYQLPDNFNPIKERVSYTIDKKFCEQLMQDAPSDVRDTLAQLIDKKPGKASVVLKERI